MRSRWNEAEAAALEGVDLLVYASRLVGAETSLVVWGGGNTSVKVTERDHRGREIAVLRVKGSGSDLKSIQRKDFPGVRMDDIRALLERQDMGDEEMVAYLAHALQVRLSGQQIPVRHAHPFLAARYGRRPHSGQAQVFRWRMKLAYERPQKENPYARRRFPRRPCSRRMPDAVSRAGRRANQRIVSL